MKPHNIISCAVSLALLFAGLFLSPLGVFALFKHTFPRHPASLTGSAVPCAGAAAEPAGTTGHRPEPPGTGPVRHGAAPAPLTQVPAASTWPRTPNTLTHLKYSFWTVLSIPQHFMAILMPFLQADSSCFCTPTHTDMNCSVRQL